ncbi:MAG: hypothetical protein QXI60_03080 [Thermofilaceae archaeon]
MNRSEKCDREQCPWLPGDSLAKAQCKEFYQCPLCLGFYPPCWIGDPESEELEDRLCMGCWMNWQGAKVWMEVMTHE